MYPFPFQFFTGKNNQQPKFVLHSFYQKRLHGLIAVVYSVYCNIKLTISDFDNRETRPCSLLEDDRSSLTRAQRAALSKVGSSLTRAQRAALNKVKFQFDQDPASSPQQGKVPV